MGKGGDRGWFGRWFFVNEYILGIGFGDSDSDFRCGKLCGKLVDK
jgi:hypothetical protein